MQTLLRCLVGAGLLALAGVVFAQEKQPDETFDAIITDSGANARDVLYGEVVNSIHAPRISGFRVIDNQRVVIYTSPFRPYLLTLDRGASGLAFEQNLALKYKNGRIHSRFDSVVVDGIPHFIKRIEKLDKETAKSLSVRDKSKLKDDTREDKEPTEGDSEAETGA